MINSVLDSKKLLFLTMIYYINSTLFHKKKQKTLRVFPVLNGMLRES